MNRGTTVSRTRDFHVLGVLETVSDIIRWRVQRGGEGVPPRETWGLFFKKQRRIIHLNPYKELVTILSAPYMTTRPGIGLAAGEECTNSLQHLQRHAL